MRRRPSLRIFLTCVLAAALTMAVAPVIGPVPIPSLREVLLWLLIVVIGHWLGVFAHELGHAGAGLTQGMTLKQFAVGPVLVDWSQGAARLRRNGLRGPAGGFIRFAGDDAGSPGSVRAHFWMTLGGPGTGFLAGIILIEIGTLLATSPGWLRYGLLAAGAWGVLVSAINLLPLRTGMTRSDGAWLLALARGGAEAEELIRLIRWIDALHSLEAPGNWSPELVEEMEAALAHPEPSTANRLDLAVLAGYLLYYHYADRDEWHEANHVISTAAELPRPAKKRSANSPFDMVDVMHAVHLALRGRNPLGARASLDRIHPRSYVRRNSLYTGALAAIALAEEDATTAIERARAAKKVLAPSLAFVAADQLEDSWWDDVITRAQALVPRESPAQHPAERPVPVPAVAGAASPGDATFAWDPGVPSDLRTIWIWRGRLLIDLTLRA